MGRLDPRSRRPRGRALLFVDAENNQVVPRDVIIAAERHAGSPMAERRAYGKAGAASSLGKKYRRSGFRWSQAADGHNDADILLSLEAYEAVRDLAERGICGTLYVAFFADLGYVHLFDKIRRLPGWRSVWLTSNADPNPALSNAVDEVLCVNPIKDPQPEKVSPKPTVSSELSFETYREVVEAVLKTPMHRGQLGPAIAEEASRRLGKKISAKAFGIQCGAKKTWTLTKTLETALGDDVSFDEHGRAALGDPSLGVDAEAAPDGGLDELWEKIREWDFEPMILGSFSSELNAIVVNAGWAKSAREYLKRYGVAKNRPLYKVLRELAGHVVEVRGEGPDAVIVKRREAVAGVTVAGIEDDGEATE